MAFNMFPFTNLHNLNTDWILKTIKEAKEAVDESLAAVREALTNAVLYTSQSKDTSSRRVACTNIHAVSYDSTPLQSAEAAQARYNIGAAAASAIPDFSDVLRYSAQSLTDEQKLQARTNQGTASSEALVGVAGRVNILENSSVSYAAQQQLTATQQTTARGNIGAAPSVGVVMYNTAQTLDDSYKAQARQNIGAIAASDVPVVTGAVVYNEAQSLTGAQKLQARNNINAAVSASYLRYDAQSLTASQKQQARANIGVSGAEDQPLIVTVLPNELGTGYECDTTVADIIEAAEYGRLIVILFTPISSNTEYQCVAYIDPVSSPNTVVAYAYDPADPGSVTAFYWYRIYLAAGSGSDTLTVTQQAGRMVPVPQTGDTGKLLGVANNGRPAWQQILPETVTDLSSTSITLASAADNTIYQYGELTALTISAITNPGEFIISWRSGSTPTTINFPTTMRFPTSTNAMDACEANTDYEVNCRNGKCVVTAWPVVSP